MVLTSIVLEEHSSISQEIPTETQHKSSFRIHVLLLHVGSFSHERSLWCFICKVLFSHQDVGIFVAGQSEQVVC